MLWFYMYLEYGECLCLVFYWILSLELLASLCNFNFIFWLVLKHQRRHLIISLHKAVFTIRVARIYRQIWRTISIKKFYCFFLCQTVVAEQNTCRIWNTLLSDIRLQTISWFGEQIPAHNCFIEGKPDLSLDILAIIYWKYAFCTLANQSFWRL